MLKYAGEMVRIAREECGMSKSNFVKNAKTLSISRKTLTRIEEGDTSVKEDTVTEVLAYFGINDLYTLRDANEEKIFKEALIPWDGDPLGVRLSEVKARIYEYRSLFAEEKINHREFPIDTLFKILLYLPFLDELNLFDRLLRIGGDFSPGRGFYALELLKGLYDDIPDSKEKRAADNIAKSITSMDEMSPDDDIHEYTIMLEKKLKRVKAIIAISRQMAKEIIEDC